MEFEMVLRELANVINRAWYRCEGRSPNSELLNLLSIALSEASLDRRRDREQKEAEERERAEERRRHDTEEKEIRERMPPVE